MSMTQLLLSSRRLAMSFLRPFSTATNNIKESAMNVDFAPQKEEELDKLYKLLEVEVRAHNPAVLDSYRDFAVMAAKELDVNFVKSWNPFRTIKRRILLKSAVIYKDHRVHYEWRTYYLMMHFKNLTGSTLDTYLEYIERNLPEGCAMRVSKHELSQFPDHLKPPTET